MLDCHRSRESFNNMSGWAQSRDDSFKRSQPRRLFISKRRRLQLKQDLDDYIKKEFQAKMEEQLEWTMMEIRSEIKGVFDMDLFEDDSSSSASTNEYCQDTWCICKDEVKKDHDCDGVYSCNDE